MYNAKMVLSSTQHQSGDICTSLVIEPFKESNTHDGICLSFPETEASNLFQGWPISKVFTVQIQVNFLVFCTITLAHLHLLSWTSISFWRPCLLLQIIQELFQKVPLSNPFPAPAESPKFLQGSYTSLCHLASLLNMGSVGSGANIWCFSFILGGRFIQISKVTLP